MSGHTEIKFGFAVEVVQGDALQTPGDVLAVKYAPNSSGLDAHVRKGLGLDASFSPVLGEHFIFDGAAISKADRILMVGTGSMLYFHYDQIRELGRDFLRILSFKRIKCEHLITTAQGVRSGIGLDESEAFRALLLGFADAYESREYPANLTRITIVERNQRRAALLQSSLDRFLRPIVLHADEIDDVLPGSIVERAPSAYAEALPRDMPSNEVELKEVVPTPRVRGGPETFNSAFRGPVATAETPHVFVAMPFAEDYEDQFYLAIQPCIQERGYLCERMDHDHFTGDIIDRMLERIRTAKLVVALLDGGNPNVFLEVGYAWGVDTSTVLIAREGEPLPFDIKTQRVLIYDKIHKLKDMLAGELDKLLPDLDSSHG